MMSYLISAVHRIILTCYFGPASDLPPPWKKDQYSKTRKHHTHRYPHSSHTKYQLSLSYFLIRWPFSLADSCIYCCWSCFLCNGLSVYRCVLCSLLSWHHRLHIYVVCDGITASFVSCMPKVLLSQQYLLELTWKAYKWTIILDLIFIILLICHGSAQ